VVRQKFSELSSEDPIDDEAFEQKLRNIKKIKLSTFVSLEALPGLSTL